AGNDDVRATELALHLESSEQVARQFHSSLSQGLMPEEAALRLKRAGRNLLASPRPSSDLSILIGQFSSPPVAVLGVAALLSLATGGLVELLAIVGVLALNAAIGFVTESRARKTIQSLGL